MKKDKREIFIEKAKKVHFGENLDYSQVVYINNRIPVAIIDHDLDENGNEYGVFYQTPYNHLKGQMHPKKRNKRISEAKSLSCEEFIERAKKVHKNENMDYSQVVYKNMHTKVKIICHDLDKNGDEYGEFWQEPIVHLKGCTHPRKALDLRSIQEKYTTEIFIQKSKELYGEEKYNYNEVDYINSKTKVKIFCNEKDKKGKVHGYFLTSPDLFLQGKGCPKCGNQLSHAEDEIFEMLCGLVGKENIIRHDSSVLEGQELDLYIPKYRFAIEYNGLRWHSEKFGKDKNYHLFKTEKCEEKGITLFQIFEDEYINHEDIVFDKIKHFLNKNTDKIKVGARKCVIKEINNKTAKEFLEKYHIQGYSSATVHIGGYYEENLIGVMSFKYEDKTSCKWELSRFSTDYNYTCQGLASKLFSYFLNKYQPCQIKTFLDRRWCNSLNGNNIYKKLNFEVDGILKPDYRYTNGHGERKHKFLFRKQILHKKYGLDLTLTESEMIDRLGYSKVWDCGLIRYVWKKENNNEER